MKEILLTSSVLILALLLLRVLFRSAVSRRVQYALWLLVLVRLLVPVHLPAVNFSLLTAAEPVGQAMTEQLDRQELYIPTDREPLTPSGGPGPCPQSGDISIRLPGLGRSGR